MVNRITRWKVLVGAIPIIVGMFLYSRFEPAPKLDLHYIPSLNQPIQDLSYIVKLQPNLKDFTYKGEVEIRFKAKSQLWELILNSKKLKTEGKLLSIDGKDFSKYLRQKRIFNERLIKRDLVVYKFNQEAEKDSNVTLIIGFSGIINDNMAGFYRSNYTNEITGVKEFLVSTQMEPAHARTVFPCIDEPEAKATFKLIIDIPNRFDVISNTVVQSTIFEAEDLAINHKRVFFFETLPMSTYLFAFAIGKFDYVESELYDSDLDSTVKLRVYTTEGLATQGEFALDVAIKTLDLFRKIFALPYPMTKLDLVAIPDFDAGAMENWGLITFRPNLLLFNPTLSTLATKQLIASVVAHEVAHQWFGNLVTMQWWSHLWLNEGFATWAGHYAVDKLFPEWDFWTEFTVSCTESALLLDAKITSHPVEVDVVEVDQISEIFDAISYNKGAGLIRMLAEYVGEDNFFKGVRTYLKQFAFRNARTMDLWAAIGEASGKDVETFMSKWTRQVGFPLVQVEHVDDVLKLSQRRFINQPDRTIEYLSHKWTIPLKGTTAIEHVDIVETLDTQHKLVSKFPGGVYKLNYNFTSLYRVQYDTSHLDLIISVLTEDINAFSVLDKINLISDVAALSKAQVYRTVKMLELFKAFKKERNYYVWKQLIAHLDHFQQVWDNQPDPIPARVRSFKLDLFTDLVAELGWEPSDTETEQTQMLRALAIYHAGTAGDILVAEQARFRFERMVEANRLDNVVDPNLIQAVLVVTLMQGKAEDYQRVKKFYLDTTNPDQKLTALTALGSVANEKLLRETLAFCIGPEVRPMDLARCINGVSRNCDGREISWYFLKANWDDLFVKYEQNFQTLGQLLQITVGRIASNRMLTDFDNFFGNNNRNKEGYQRTFEQTKETILDSLRWIKSEEDSIKLFFNVLD